MKSTPRTEPNHRILVIDDNRAINEDMRKILIGDSSEPSDLEADEQLLFDDAPVAATCFKVDSAFQGQEGLSMLERSIAEGRPLQWHLWICGCRRDGTAWKRSRGFGKPVRTCR